MSFWHNIRNAFKRSSATATARVGYAPRMGITDMIAPGGNGLGIATAYRCVNLLADSVANLPLQYMVLRGGLFEEDRGSRLHYLLNVQPCDYMSSVDFWRLAVQNILLNGNAYIVPVYDYSSIEVSRLAIVDPTCVAHDTVNDTYTIHDVNASISGTFSEAEVIHLKNFTRDGKRGLSVIGFARTALDITATGDAETLTRFANGGTVRGLVSNDTSVRGFGEYQDAELNKTAQDLDTRFRNGERIVSLPGQVQFNPISLTSTDMQFLETRKFSVREICRFFGVHPSLVFDDTSGNYKSAEMASTAFLFNTLNPILRRIEVELHRKLVPPRLCCKRKFLFDRRGLYACDLDSKVRYQASTIAAGLYTVNEWRKEENKPPVEGGDTVLVSANLRSVNEATAGKEADPGVNNSNNNNDEDEE